MLVVLEDGLSAIAAIHEVIHRAGILNAQLARHGGRLTQGFQLCQQEFVALSQLYENVPLRTR